jgi:murein L,D-transpeptidase YafK
MVANVDVLRGVAVSLPMLIRLRAVMFAAGCAIALSGCYSDSIFTGEKASRPLSNEMTSLIERKGMAKETPVLVRIFKEESELEVWKQTTAGSYELLKTYPICRWSGELGPKVKQGDRQAPEGFYMITPGLMNPHSSYYLAFNMGFPNSFDKALGRSGSNLMVHGDCSSSGCYAMTDEQIGEIFALARDSFEGGQRAFQVQAYPFRMTPVNLAKHRNNPNIAFWRMLKEGNDHFEVTRQEPKVEVCDQRYVFNAIPFDPRESFSPQRTCPVFDQPVEVAEAVKTKRDADNKEYGALVSRGVATAPVMTYRDGGMNPVFAAKYPERNPFSNQKIAVTPGRALEAEVTPVPSMSIATSSAPSVPSVVTVTSAPSGPSVIPATTSGNDPRLKAAAAADPVKPLGALDRIGAWLGLHKEKTNAPAVQPTQTATISNPPPPAKQTTPAVKPKPALQVTAPTSPVAQPKPAPTQETTTPAPSSLPGSAPILSSGGFSSLR